MGRVVHEEMEVFRDHRGAAFEPVAGEALGRFGNVHVVTTGPGHVRGNHLHSRATEVLVVRGPARVAWRGDGEEGDVPVPAGAYHRFIIPPGIAHAVKNTGDGENLLVALRDTPDDPDDPDVQPVELLT